MLTTANALSEEHHVTPEDRGRLSFSAFLYHHHGKQYSPLSSPDYLYLLSSLQQQTYHSPLSPAAVLILFPPPHLFALLSLKWLEAITYHVSSISSRENPGSLFKQVMTVLFLQWAILTILSHGTATLISIWDCVEDFTDLLHCFHTAPPYARSKKGAMAFLFAKF